ncbi:hypothetical protein [Halanaerobaculum tunisiense]
MHELEHEVASGSYVELSETKSRYRFYRQKTRWTCPLAECRSIPEEWKNELENLVRIYSVEEETTLTYLDLMRRAIQEKYGLDSNE